MGPSMNKSNHLQSPKFKNGNKVKGVKSEPKYTEIEPKKIKRAKKGKGIGKK